MSYLQSHKNTMFPMRFDNTLWIFCVYLLWWLSEAFDCSCPNPLPFCLDCEIYQLIVYKDNWLKFQSVFPGHPEQTHFCTSRSRETEVPGRKVPVSLSVYLLCRHVPADTTHATHCMLQIKISQPNRRLLPEIETSQLVCHFSKGAAGSNHWMVRNFT